MIIKINELSFRNTFYLMVVCLVMCYGISTLVGYSVPKFIHHSHKYIYIYIYIYILVNEYFVGSIFKRARRLFDGIVAEPV